MVGNFINSNLLKRVKLPKDLFKNQKQKTKQPKAIHKRKQIFS